MRIDKVGRRGGDEMKGGRKGRGIKKTLQQHSRNCTHESLYDWTVLGDVSFKALNALMIRT